MDERALIAAVKAWMAEDPDLETRAEADTKLASGDLAGLLDAFSTRLAFGTAGLRGAMGAGPNRMNRVMVRRATAGLADHLLVSVPDAARRGVVIGYDGRKNSEVFAADAAAVLLSKGIAVHRFDRVVATPIVGFATTDLGAAAGIVITASHNPPADNGYKVFRANGAQIIPPDDDLISAAIDAHPPVGALPSPDGHPLARGIAPELLDRYFAAIAGLRVHHSVGARIVYTAMHGVGAAYVRRALAAAGHTDLHEVAEQVQPDGRFPTVTFPNPEEPGALALAMRLATAVQADVILANDPDADRLAVAVPDGRGGWRQLTGNQVGVLLADDLLRHRDTGGKRPMVATTIVSTSLLARIAAANGADYAETLTGFKWIGDRAIAHDAAGGAFVVGFEEALGYTAGSVVRDKDGVSTLLLLADLASWLKANGRTLSDALDEVYRRYGLSASRQKSLTLAGAEGKAEISRIMTRLRSRPPGSIGGSEVIAMRDLAEGYARGRDGTITRLDLPRSDVLAFDLADGGRVLARPSGTEPKIKFYVEASLPVGDRSIAEVAADGERALDGMIAEILAAAGVS